MQNRANRPDHAGRPPSHVVDRLPGNAGFRVQKDQSLSDLKHQAREGTVNQRIEAKLDLLLRESGISIDE